MASTSVNFHFLAEDYPLLAQLGALAERYYQEDPSTSLIKLRQLAELIAKEAAACTGLYTEEDFSSLIRSLSSSGALEFRVKELFHSLRRAGNAAAHEVQGSHSAALNQLKNARNIAIWFYRSFGGHRHFKPTPFIPPQEDPAEAPETLKLELKQLREALEASLGEVNEARTQAEAAIEAKRTALVQKRKALSRAEEEAAVWEEMAREAETQRIEAEARLKSLQAEKSQQALVEQQGLIDTAFHAGLELELDEADTRKLIDQQLRDVGWLVDSQEMRYAKGTRPQKGKNTAIAEWPTASGPSDYVLFVGLTPVAVVEAKHQGKDVPGALQQAKRYSRDFKEEHLQHSLGGPWGEYRIPFLFATNGRPYLRQLETKSGIWFLDARRPQNTSHALEGWYTPEGLQHLLQQDIDAAHARLAQEPTDYLQLRDYQIDAIKAVEATLAEGQRACLLAMATGTGKTRTTLGLIYRLIKTKRFRRVLFLVDRTALGVQAENTFKDVRLESLQTFGQIFDIKGLRDLEPEEETKVHFATVQGMVRRVLNAEEPEETPPVDLYDCIVIDESHRGYNLDQEMSEVELTFRDQADYISKYRRVLDHFDAVKIALTATPALHTKEIFGAPVYRYSYRDAVIGGYLVDHEPPLRIVTRLAQDGIRWKAGAEVTVFDQQTRQLDLFTLEDEVRIEIEGFNRRVITEPFNRAVCAELAKHIDPYEQEKTLIFCATDAHADLVVNILKEELNQLYGQIYDNTIVKITGASDRPLELIRRYRNEQLPNIAVTVDLLSTGIDVPKIANLVFLRRVRSRILYEQMLGRATRLCPEIGKERFRVFDAVDLYAALQDVSDMKPVVTNPHISFEQLALELIHSEDQEVQDLVLSQLVAKLQRKKVYIKGRQAELFEAAAGAPPKVVLQSLTDMEPAQAAHWFSLHQELAPLLDRSTGRERKLYVSQEEDEVVEVGHGYGEGKRPEDYLDAFATFIREHRNDIPALLLVMQRPRNLTRADLKALKLALDQHGYSETRLQTAWRDKTNQEIAASIIGFIRQAALGDPLVAYATRVDRAVTKIKASRAWTQPQRQWLDRIAKQLAKEIVVDRAVLDEETFRQHGGFHRLNKIFEGELETLLDRISDAIWEVGA